MRLVRQVSLFFKEGNSDKVYEIDLCTTGNELYVVNFRYGRRGTVLKEGTKTQEPVSLQKAEDLFAELEQEKRSKGYKSFGESSTTIQSEIPTTLPDINLNEITDERKKAVLIRLKDAVEGKSSSKFPWKTSRVIWLAGVMKWEETADYILLLANKENLMQQYSAAWALGRCGNEKATPLLYSYFKSGAPVLQRIAGAALLRVANEQDKQKQLDYYLHSLPEPLQLAITNHQAEELKTLLNERVLQQVQQHYNLLEDLYLVAQEHKWIKPFLKELLTTVPLKPPHFRHVRHIFKLAEFFDDFETAGLLARRFEKEEAMFTITSNPYEDDDERKVYIESLKESINPQKELSKKTSRLAYSNKTKQYLIKRTLRLLNKYGQYHNLDYVRLATALLLSYDKEKDYSAPYSTYNYEWRGDNYQRVEYKFPAYAGALYLNQILFGNSPEYKLLRNNLWTTVDPNEATKQANNKRRNTGANQGRSEVGLLQKIINFFTGKKPATVKENKVEYSDLPDATGQKKEISTVQSGSPYLFLWNKLPQAFIQLLIHGRVEEIHQFAFTNLQQHPEYNNIKNKLTIEDLEQLFSSSFSLPAEFAFVIAQERYNAVSPDTQLVKAMLCGKSEQAQAKAKEWVEQSIDAFLFHSGFVAAVLLCPNVSVRNWIDKLITGHSYPTEIAQAIVARALAQILTTNGNNVVNETIQHAGSLLIKHFSSALKEIDILVVEDLLGSKTPSAQMFGVEILLLRRESLDYDSLSNTIFYSLTNSGYTPLRVKGMELLNALSSEELLKRQELIIQCCTVEHREVRSMIRPIIKRMAEKEHSFGVQAAEWLLPYLLRKEISTGLHEDVSAILSNELIEYMGGVNKELALRLLYSDYIPTQEFGIAVLQKYIDADQLSLKQIIALGNHETKSVREWSWKYFENNVSRIKYEREDAIRLLDVNWDDTREFAKEFFRKEFSEQDWAPEILVGLADSVRPDIEAFGRELITRFFNEEWGEQYLIKLSQHPSEKMQIFATNYLERFASDDLKKLQSLEFYFRSVLTRVNKARVAKNRIFRFLAEEGKKSEEAARFIGNLISQVSATVSIEDKARCIEILLSLQSLFDIQTPMIKKPVEERI